MHVRIAELTIEGAPLEGANPLPQFRNPEPHRDVAYDGDFREEHRAGIGRNAGERYLPYRMQDRYSRERRALTLKTIVLANDKLEATFLPDYGGRLYSLRDRASGRELLYRNPVFQPANLAILNAWFSGGIEWNVSQVGHTYTTCSPMHAALLRDDEGSEFLRLYEYERSRGVFWQLDFHLPPGSEQLLLYARIVNDGAETVPMYWWTNIAVEETPGARVFSATDEVIYIKPSQQGFGLGRLPHLPSVPGEDASYPLRFPFSNEYFFQNPADGVSPWEAVAYEDGRLFYERSTSRLRYRKMFCWGHHAGGRRWCDFLAKPGEGAYIEVQGGFAPTQVHGLDMPPGAAWDFTQAFGMTTAEPALTEAADWREAQRYVEGRVAAALSAERVGALHERLAALADRPPERALHAGSGWGALEARRRAAAVGASGAGASDARAAGAAGADASVGASASGGAAVAPPAGLPFAAATLGEEQADWLALLERGRLPETDPAAVPRSWMVDAAWRRLLEASLEREENRDWYAYLHLGVMLYEAGRLEEAVAAWGRSVAYAPSVWAYRNLAEAARRAGETEAALTYWERAAALVGGAFPDRALAEEYLSLLVQGGRHEEAWRVYRSLPPAYAAADRIRITVGEAALALGEDAFVRALFEREFAVIREGELRIVELWYKAEAKRLAAEAVGEAAQALAPDEWLERARRDCPPPANIDFRMIGG